MQRALIKKNMLLISLIFLTLAIIGFTIEKTNDSRPYNSIGIGIGLISALIFSITFSIFVNSVSTPQGGYYIVNFVPWTEAFSRLFDDVMFWLLFFLVGGAVSQGISHLISSYIKNRKREKNAKLCKTIEKEKQSSTSISVEKLTDQKTLADIAMSDTAWHVCGPAIYKLSDDALLAEVAKKAKNPDVRIEAIKKITDQGALSYVAQNDSVSSVKLEALKKLNDQAIVQKVFMKMAKTAKEVAMRITAVKAITDQSFLIDMAQNENESTVRIEAVRNRKLTDQRILADIIKNEKVSNIRKAAVWKLNDQAVLTDVIMNDTDFSIVLDTERRMKDLGLSIDSSAQERIRDAKAGLKQKGKEQQKAAAKRKQTEALEKAYSSKPSSILDKYRAGLSFLDECGAFDEAKFRKFNHVIGNRFSEVDITTQLRNAELMIRGMENIKQTLRSTMVEGISMFEELERSGIDLSKFEV